MAKELSYKKSVSTTLKAVGLFDANAMTLEIDGSSKKLHKLLEDFDGCSLELTAKVSYHEDLDIPNTAEESGDQDS